MSGPRSTPRTAAEWFAARLAPHDAALEREFERWREADPRHAEEYALCEAAWALGAEAGRGLDVRSTPTTHSVLRNRRRVLVAAGVACIAAITAIFALRGVTPPALVWHTQPGEQRTLVLDDGSRVTLNTRTTLEVRLARDERALRLVEGEAYFDVAREAARPFVVRTPLGSARAVGTRFNVLLDGDRAEIATEEGEVFVQSSDAATDGVLATAGTRATVVRGVARPSLDPVDLVRVQNWRERRLEFDGVPLDDVLHEFSRYTPRPVRAATPEIGRMQVSAVLKAGDVAALRATLTGAFGLDVVPRDDGWVVARP